MNALDAMAEAAAHFQARLLREPGCARRVVPPVAAPADLEWSNLLLSGPAFRHGHVETFAVPGRLRVLHVCLFPRLDDASPIFGFDMIAGPARVTGCFLDLSPVAAAVGPRLRDVVDPARLAGFALRRDLPAWGEIFSEDVLAIRPADAAEVARAIALALQALDGWLARPHRRACPGAAVITAAEIKEGQARYIAGQRRNEHTLRMLAGFVGADAARRFIDEVLFPPIPQPDSSCPRAA